MYQWELDALALREFDGLPSQAQKAVATFMDAVVLVDPLEYQRRADEPADSNRTLRTLHFGPHSEGLVTFLVYEPDDLVLVVKIQWTGG